MIFLPNAVTTRIEAANVSMKHSIALCREIKNKRVENAKKLMEDLISEKRSLRGKYYTKAAKKFLEILKNAENNAKNKNLNTEKLFIKIAKADRAFTYIKPKSRVGLRGRRAKLTNLTIEVVER